MSHERSPSARAEKHALRLERLSPQVIAQKRSDAVNALCALGWTYDKIARRVGVHPCTIKCWKLRRTPGR